MKIHAPYDTLIWYNQWAFLWLVQKTYCQINRVAFRLCCSLRNWSILSVSFWMFCRDYPHRSFWTNYFHIFTCKRESSKHVLLKEKVSFCLIIQITGEFVEKSYAFYNKFSCNLNYQTEGHSLSDTVLIDSSSSKRFLLSTGLTFQW